MKLRTLLVTIGILLVPAVHAEPVQVHREVNNTPNAIGVTYYVETPIPESIAMSMHSDHLVMEALRVCKGRDEGVLPKQLHVTTSSSQGALVSGVYNCRLSAPHP